MTVHFGSGTRLPEDVKREIVRRYTADDESIRVIAAAIGCSYGAAHLALSTAGTSRRFRAGSRRPAARATRRPAADPSGRTLTPGAAAPAPGGERAWPLTRAAELEASSAERPLRSDDLDHLCATADGVLLTGDLRNVPGGTPVGWSNRRAIVWSLPIPAGIRAQAALRLAARPGVRTVTIVGNRSNPERLAVACTYAAQLAAARTNVRRAGPPITAEHPPVTPPGTVRVPHLVTTTGTVTKDLVVWELMTVDQALSWFVHPLPDPRLVESRIPQLLALRAAARSRRLPATDAGRRLAGLLTDRPLSIRLVYQHPTLFTDLLADAHRQPANAREATRPSPPRSPAISAPDGVTIPESIGGCSPRRNLRGSYAAATSGPIPPRNSSPPAAAPPLHPWELPV